MPPRVPILILAAGASSRMGGLDKLVEPVAGGVPLLRDRAETALATGQPVLVALPPEIEAPARRAAVAGLAVTTLSVPDAGKGLSASLRAGIAALPPGARGVVIVLADMPEITAEDIAAVIGAFDGDHVARGCDARGKPGHPVLLPASMFGDLAALSGDQGARDVLAGLRDVRLVPLPGHHAHTDLDTREDWERWRRGD